MRGSLKVEHADATKMQMSGIVINRPGFMQKKADVLEPKMTESKKFALPVIPLRKPTGADKPSVGGGGMGMSKFG
jgi:hypothetical protein